MIGKLTKREDNYYLFVEGKPFGTNDDLYLQYEIVNKLSKQNCDDIFGVIDVEKLAEEYDPNYAITDISNGFHFIEGFNKAIELNKDKLFTLEDMRNTMDWIMTQYFEFYEQPTTGRREQYLESLQQPTEIEVEIEMEVVNHCDCQCHTDGVTMHFMACCNPDIVPKLDDNNNLILRRI